MKHAGIRGREYIFEQYPKIRDSEEWLFCVLADDVKYNVHMEFSGQQAVARDFHDTLERYYFRLGEHFLTYVDQALCEGPIAPVNLRYVSRERWEIRDKDNLWKVVHDSSFGPFPFTPKDWIP